MLIPLAEARGYQNLVLIDKDTEGKVQSQPLLSVSFVQLVAD